MRHRFLAPSVVLLVALHAVAAAAQPAATTRPAARYAAAVADARAWVRDPLEQTPIAAFSPALALHHRRYAAPRPLRLWIARVDLSSNDVRLALTAPADFTGENAKFETRCATTLDFARQRGVQLAINTSAFGPFRGQTGQPMDVVGLAAVRGKTYSPPDERFGAMYVARDGRVRLAAPPLDDDGVWHVIPGFRMLLDDRRIAVKPEYAFTSFGGVNPRTAVGVDQDGDTLWIVVVDGRQKDVSEGITLIELAALFESLGAWDALNLDGGGSSTLVIENAVHNYDVVNTPVGRGQPNTLRQVANNLGFYLPGKPPRPEHAEPTTLRDAVLRIIGDRRGRMFPGRSSDAVDLTYEGQPAPMVDPHHSSGAGATLPVFLAAYCQLHHDCQAVDATGRWFQDWPRAKFDALQQAWFGVAQPPATEIIPGPYRDTVFEQRAADVLPWAGLGTAIDDYRLLQRGDFIQFYRAGGGTHAGVFWGRDWDDKGRERLWYWSSIESPRHAYASEPGDKPRRVPGFGIDYEYIGQEIIPDRIYGARPGKVQ